jgi:SNF family Na+-dependent transporter
MGSELTYTAMAGNAVGLVTRFSTGHENEEGFIIPYLICFSLQVPLLFIEWSSGWKIWRKFETTVIPYILDSMVKGRLLKYIFCIFTNIAIASYYCYIESWTMSYVYCNFNRHV